MNGPSGESGEAQGVLAEFPPAAFAMVMATGIVSVAAHLEGFARLAQTLFALNILAWTVLWALNLLRASRYPKRFLADLGSHARAPGFFTAVAGTGVLGAQFMSLGGNPRVAAMLWVLAVVLWIALTYSVFTALTIRVEKPTLERGLSGIWLLAIVATQSVAVLAAQLAAQADPQWKFELNFFALSMWLWGGMLYIWIMTLIFYRYTFLRLSPGDLTPPYWINMGAMAISTLAGSMLVLNAPNAPFLDSLLPFLKGFTVLYWATGTWWIPMLLALGAWRYLWERFPFEYDTSYWGVVFPLGMYSVCTHEMAQALGLGFLELVPRAFLFAALVAWALTFAGLLHWLVRSAALRRSGRA
ncbi:MAG: tellurite resistance/C4-dicarboxylate transporter family protein [Burkholderiaceae bacterium]|nr:tellurite resistance/C4-dicarboxylate transporter family protein [Burkholderiaceae bacterium]